jgi:hypothetical protein
MRFANETCGLGSARRGSISALVETASFSASNGLVQVWSPSLYWYLMRDARYRSS